MAAKKQAKRFTYRVAYYTPEEQVKAPTSRSVSTVTVEATSVPRALSRAFSDLGLTSQFQWHVVSVAPVLDESEARRYQV